MHPFSVLTLAIFVAGYITARWDLVTRLYELANFAWDNGVVVRVEACHLNGDLHSWLTPPFLCSDTVIARLCDPVRLVFRHLRALLPPSEQGNATCTTASTAPSRPSFLEPADGQHLYSTQESRARASLLANSSDDEDPSEHRSSLRDRPDSLS